MAKLYFKYGAMNSSKTANALMIAHNYKQRGQKPLLVKPRIDSRDGEKVMKSRIGIQDDCIYFDELTVLKAKVYDCIIIDECQFLSEKDILFLTFIVDGCNTPVICFGLRSDFQGNLFEGSKHLMAWADEIEEIKTICWCGKKATFNARIDEHGNKVEVGEQVQLGKEDKYIALCRKHWYEGNIGIKNNMN